MNWKSWPRSHEASNSSPVEKVTPTYLTVSLSPGLAGGPFPLTRSSFTSVRGGEPDGFGMCGRAAVSLSASCCWAGLGCSLDFACVVFAPDWSSSLPQAPRATAASRASRIGS